MKESNVLSEPSITVSDVITVKVKGETATFPLNSSAEPFVFLGRHLGKYPDLRVTRTWQPTGVTSKPGRF